jgi:hypothetical protein
LEKIVPLRLLYSLVACASLAYTAHAASFDAPTFKKTVDLGPSRSSPGTRAKVTCYFFPHFLVKEVDMGEKGAQRLAVVAGKSKDHTCSRLRDPGERVINPDEWSGYFKGVKGDLVFFDADDGVNGGLGFAVYDSKTMKKIFDDVALGELKFSDAGGDHTTLAYTRVVDGGCIVPNEQNACWDKIKTKLGLESASAPDCKAGYENSAQQLAKGRCQAQNADNPQCVAKEIELARRQTNDANSVIAYPVEVVLSANPAIKPVAGNTRCWPSD